MPHNEPDDDKRDGSDVDPDEEPAIDTFYQAIIHGSGLGFHHSDTEIYDDTRGLWYDEVGDPGGKSVVTSYTPDFADETYHFFLVSSRWKAGVGEGDDFSNYYEYILYARTKRDTDGEYQMPPQRLKLTIQPQLDQLVYKDGNDLELPHGEGTRVKIETTYAETSDEVLRRGQRLLSELYDDYDRDGIEWDTGNITKLETHYRFDRQMMETAVTGLINTQRLISWMGRSVIKGGETRRRAPGWDIYKFASGAWSRLGFPSLGDYIIGLKAYSMSNWEDYDSDSPFYHPKIEAFYMGRKSTENAPSVDDWDELVTILRHITAHHAHNWIGISGDDLIEDPYFNGSDAPLFEYEVLEGRRDDLRSMQQDTKTAIMQEALKSRSNVPYELLASMIDHPHGVPFKTLRERLDVTQETVRHHAKRMEDAGIAERVGNPGELRFKSRVVHETATETIEEMNPGDTASDQRERREDNLSDDSDDSDDSNERTRYTSLGDGPLTDLTELERAVEIGVLDEDKIRHEVIDKLSDDEERYIRAAMAAHTPANDD